MRVLVVDDDEGVRLSFLLLLEELGYPADAVADGGAALAVLSRCSYDVILMDYDMPILNGVETTRAIRARLPCEVQPVIIGVTGKGADARATCLAAGMDDFLTKPVRPEQLGDTLCQWLGIP